MEDGDFRALARRASLELALMLLVALGASFVLHTSAPLALGTVALAVLAARLRAFGSPRSVLPNVVTALRVGLTGGLAWNFPSLSPAARAGTVALVFALDGVDGYVARRQGASSLLGAHFDMEADAYLMLTVCTLHAFAGLGTWVLTGGLLRYSYVLLSALRPLAGEPPRSLFARYALGFSLTAMTLAFVVPGVFGHVLAALGTAILIWSFGRTFWWMFARGDRTDAVDSISGTRAR